MKPLMGVRVAIRVEWSHHRYFHRDGTDLGPRVPWTVSPFRRAHFPTGWRDE